MNTISQSPKKGKQSKPKTRNTYTADHREKARKYYLMGLNLQEISKLLDGCPVRTLEKWQTSGQWTNIKNCEPLKSRALELKTAGKSMQEICKTLQISKVTAWRYIKAAQNEN